MGIGTKLDAKSAIIRQTYLAPYGGWLGYVVILGSDLLGIWEFLLLALIVVLSWVVIRSATMEIALILGFAFDCAIPLQYRNDPARRASYENRLNSYWTTFLVGVAVEAGAYCLLHPDLFTIIVAFKTLICTWIWMAKGKVRPALGGLNVKAITSQNSSLRSQAGNGAESRSATGTTAAPVSTSVGDPSLDWWMQMDERLEKMGYTDRGGRCGMIEAYSALSGQDEKEKLWKKWTHVDEKDALCANYKAKLEANRAKSLAPLPKEDRFGDIYQRLADYYPDPLVRWALMYKLRRWTDAAKAEVTLNKWLTEPAEIRRRTAQYRQVGLEKGALKRKEKADGSGRPSTAAPPNPPEPVYRIDTSSEPRVAGARPAQHGRNLETAADGRRLAEESEAARDRAAMDRETEEKAARQKRIMDNFQLTLEHYPEAFGEVSMAYIDMSVDGHPVRALVDSGARISVLSGGFAREAGLHDLIDTRWATVAHGVGSAHIIGRIHSVPIVVGGLHRVSTFYVIEGFKDLVLLGMDFFKRYGCVIDHARDGLHIENAFVPFVHGAELSRAARQRAAELQTERLSQGNLSFRPESLKAYTKKLVKAGYPKAIVPFMLDDMMDQPTVEAMQKRMNIFVNATGNPAAQDKVIQYYQAMKG